MALGIEYPWIVPEGTEGIGWQTSFNIIYITRVSQALTRGAQTVSAAGRVNRLDGRQAVPVLRLCRAWGLPFASVVGLCRRGVLEGAYRDPRTWHWWVPVPINVRPQILRDANVSTVRVQGQAWLNSLKKFSVVSAATVSGGRFLTRASSSAT